MDAFAALADETRRTIVETLAAGEQSVGSLADRCALSQPAISQHLKVLREAGLVAVRPVAQRRFYRLNPEGFRVIDLWLERYRRVLAQRFDRLEQSMDQSDGEGK